MATPGAASGAGCSEAAGRLECLLVDPIRDATLSVAVPSAAGRGPTLGDVLAAVRSADPDSTDPERSRFADGLFLLTDDGALGDLIPGLRFRVGRRPCDLDRPIGGARVEIDRSETGYPRNWPAYLSRRWRLRADAYARFVESAVEAACGREAGSVLRLDTTDRIRRFLAAVAGRIFAAPYETYSRYLDPASPFKGCDQALDRIIAGDGGNCAEKAMALYFIARAHGIGAEVVLGGEEASGKFPHRALRAILDQRAFDDEATRDAQRHWQHYAILCRPSSDASDEVFCDVAGSNIPFLFLGAEEAAPYLDPDRRTPIRVAITLEPIRLYYQRLSRRQDLPLDLYYAMEHLIASIDVIHTVDNELGLLHAGDFWVGAIAPRGRRELGRIARGYEQFVFRAGLDPRADLCFARDLAEARHPLHGRFLDAHPRAAGRIVAADARLRRRVESANPGSQIHYVVMKLQNQCGTA